MGSLATITAAVGGVLLLVGFSAAVMQKISTVARVLCCALGVVLLLTSFWLVVSPD